MSNIFSNMMDDRKKTRRIEKKMDDIKHTRQYAQEADDLKTEFGLSDDEAVFMAKKKIAKQKRSDTLSKLSSGLGDVIGGLDVGGPVQQPPSRKTAHTANKGKGGKKKKGKSKPKESKNNTSDPLGMPEFDIPGFKF